MPKNKGKGGKNRKRGKNEADDEKRALMFKEDGQEYAQFLRILGNDRVLCTESRSSAYLKIADFRFLETLNLKSIYFVHLCPEPSLINFGIELKKARISHTPIIFLAPPLIRRNEKGGIFFDACSRRTLWWEYVLLAGKTWVVDKENLSLSPFTFVVLVVETLLVLA